jgi:hypothetical protein
MKTTAAFVPLENAGRAAVIADFERLQSELTALVRSADGLPLHRVRIASPFAERLHYSVYSALTILPSHQQRHIQQAERVLAGVIQVP